MKSGLITLDFVNTVIKRRERNIHKGDCGRILLIAGTLGMAGAAILCARGALRSGAGLVSIAAPVEIFPILQVGIPEATCVSRKSLNLDKLRYDAVAAGPGLGEEKENVELIKKILSEYEGTFVLDADGLNQIALNRMQAEVRNASCKVIMTPHMGEAARLMDIDLEHAKNTDRVSLAASLAEKTNAIVVLKGEGSIVATRWGASYTNTTGNPGMATGGSGDVLTGIITSLAGQGLSPVDAAKAGVYIHGMAGDIGSENVGEYGLIAGDIAEMTALAIKQILG